MYQEINNEQDISVTGECSMIGVVDFSGSANLSDGSLISETVRPTDACSTALLWKGHIIN
jgi:hypothetical protein